MSGSTLPTLAHAFGAALFAPTPDGCFERLTPLPERLAPFFPDAGTAVVDLEDLFPYLSAFLPEARALWAAAGSGPLHSGPWTETVGAHEEMLEAVALCCAAAEQSVAGEADGVSTSDHSDDGPLLLLRPWQVAADVHRAVLQESRALILEQHALQRAAARREMLLHCLAHDLATPVASVRSSLLLLREDDLVAGAGRELLDVGLRQIQQVQRMLHHLRPVLAATPDAPATTDLHRLAQDALAPLTPVARLQGIALELRVADTADEPAPTWTVRGASDRLARLVANLLDNALRHGPPGSRVTVALAAGAATRSLTVADRGPGVPEAQRADLFRPYRRSDDGGQAGLGLYYCRLTAEAYGGRMHYAPREGGGACFRLTLPATSPTD